MEKDTILLNRKDYDKFKDIERQYNLMLVNKPFIVLETKYVGSVYYSHHQKFVNIIDNDDEVITLLKQTIEAIKPEFDKLEKENHKIKESKKKLFLQIERLENKVLNLKSSKKSWNPFK